MGNRCVILQSVVLGWLLSSGMAAAPATFAPSPGWDLHSPPSVPAPAAPQSKEPAHPEALAEVKMDFKVSPGPFAPTWDSIKPVNCRSDAMVKNGQEWSELVKY